MNAQFRVISHTHWDREWHSSFERFRLRLVRLIDHLLEILDANPGYLFNLDAQSVCVEDYLAIRPSRASALRRHIAEGRILVGPWYVQNDFYLASGEATVRNLLIGRRMAREYGACSQAGYAPDQFGNISQLPQILRGFGIDNFIFGRGYKFRRSDDKPRQFEPRPTEFLWRSREGSEVLAIHLCYWYNNAQRFPEDLDVSMTLLRNMETQFEGRAQTPYLLLMNGVDHLEAQENLLPILDGLNRRLEGGREIRQVTLDSYVEEVKSYIAANRLALGTHEGELRHGPDVSYNLASTASSRMYLKTANARAQALLEGKLEPLFGFIAMLGAESAYPSDHLLYLWKTLIQNHAHDSICGCSCDATHRNMEDRFLRIFEAGRDLLEEGLSFLTDHVDRSRLQPGDYLLTIANTTESARDGILECAIEFPVEAEAKTFAILDASGAQRPCELLSAGRRPRTTLSPINLPGQVDVDSYRIVLDAGAMPPFSVRHLIVRPGSAEDQAAQPIQAAETLLEGTLSIGNEHIEVRVHPGGAVDLLGKPHDWLCKDILRLEDTADCGNSYFHVAAPDDKPISGADFRLIGRTVLRTQFLQRIELDYAADLPEAYDFAAERRTPERVENRIRLALTLRKDTPWFEIEGVALNRSRDHRLRLLIRAGIASKRIQALTPFDVVERSNEGYSPKWDEGDRPHSGALCLSDGRRGLSIFAEGLPEYNHLEGSDGIVALTLVRSTGAIHNNRSVSPDHWMCPENQCLREIDFRLALYPHEGDMYGGNALAQYRLFQIPLLAHYDAADQKIFHSGRPAVQAAGVPQFFFREPEFPEIRLWGDRQFLELHGRNIVVSALKRSEDGKRYVLRCFNAGPRDEALSLALMRPIASADLAYLEEKPIRPLVFSGNTIEPFIVKAGEIVTIAFD